MASKDPQTRAHLDWLGMLVPVGLVVSPPALVKAQAVVPRNAAELQKRFVASLGPAVSREGLDQPSLRLTDFPRLALEFLEWEAEDLVGGEDLPKSLEIALPEYQQVLTPTWAVPDPTPGPNGERAWMMLIVEVDGNTDFDDAGPRDARGWRASPQIRIERLLRDTNVAIGMLVSPDTLRLVYAPSGESSGHLSFPIKAMTEVAGRPILAALHMLLCAERLFTLPSARRLPALLVDSRKYQNEVSTKLSEQILRALGELLRGFVAADDAVKGELLGSTSREDPQHIYGGLITTMMRLVFLLYAEERELMPQDSVYVEHYGVSGLFEKLRADAGLYPDTMDQRYGAWSRLLSLFRLVFDGGAHGSMRLPARQGQLFNPDEFPFLEGRAYKVARVMGARIEPPRVSDGVVYRVLEDLLILEGERLSYRSLDVEQIGSVYEAIMGFEVKRAFGPSIGVRPQHVVVNLQALLDEKPAQRSKLLENESGCQLGKGAENALRQAASLDDIVAALGQRISPQTPTPLAPGSLYLQPTEERRRSGSHYTPRSLTEPIVRTTLRPVLEALGERPTAAQILDLKVCDPAMGSGAFLVEACRQLAGKLEEAWAAHGETPTNIPPDETVELHARRLVAQRCLYGVDKNPFAVNLAKVSLWLVTLARDHALTFIDHSLKCGDSPVGLTRRQIAAFHWKEPEAEDLPLFQWVAAQVGKASSARGDIFALGDEQEAEKRLHWREAEDAVAEARLIGYLVISAFFAEEKDKAREKRRLELWEKVRAWQQTGVGGEQLRGIVEEMRGAERPIVPLHWEIEFPEVFSKTTKGFHCFVGNPPFVGGTRITTHFGSAYRDWLATMHAGVSSNPDLVAHFFRKAFSMLAPRGTFGLVAKKTIAEGDTRRLGLAWIRAAGGKIYEAKRRIEWPGRATVIVSQVHVSNRGGQSSALLDGRTVPSISAFLLAGDVDHDPRPLAANAGKAFRGCDVFGVGFLFDDSTSGATPTSVMERIIEQNPENSKRIFPYLSGSDLNASPSVSPSRHIIDFEEMSESEARHWPDLFEIVERLVKPARASVTQRDRRELWWLYATRSPSYRRFAATHARTLVVAMVSKHLAFAFITGNPVLSNKVVGFGFDESAAFSVLQSRTHEVWVRFFGSTMKDDFSYTPTTCFETYPFPINAEHHERLEQTGAGYYRFRAVLMTERDQGLTATYNRFHDPNETSEDILKLRDLHDQMDRAVLDAYGWTDIKPSCEFLLDYEDADADPTSNRKKPWRYRWPDEVQEEVLARLLDLNQKRAEEERLVGLAAEAGTKAPKKKSAKKKSAGKKQSVPKTQRKLFSES
jgi:hypothetical protein